MSIDIHPPTERGNIAIDNILIGKAHEGFQSDYKSIHAFNLHLIYSVNILV